MVPFLHNISDVAFIDDPAVLGDWPLHLDGNLIVLAMWSATLSVMVEEAMTRTDPDRSVGADLECSFPCVRE